MMNKQLMKTRNVSILINLSNFRNSYTKYCFTEISLNQNHLCHNEKNDVSIFPYDVYKALWTKVQPKCAPFPDIFDLNYHNSYWQRLSPKSDVIIDIFGAYFDDRPKVKKPVIRIIGVINVVKPNFSLSCQMWFSKIKEAQVTNVTNYNMIWNQNYIKIKDGTFTGFLITCPLPKNMTTAPLVVSLVNKPCDRANNLLKVHNNRPKDGKKKDFAVCVKGLDFIFDDLSVSLVEFIEANLMFGVDKIVTYNLGVHPNISKVLNYYESNGKMEIHPVSLPANYPNEPFLRHMFLKNRHTIKILQELIPYNDCFYKNIHIYKYILLLDIDEVFVPNLGTNYKEMLSNIEGTFSTFYAKNKIFVRNTKDTNFYKDMPMHLEMLQTTTVAKNYERPYVLNVKSFFNTDEVLTLNNHMPYECIGKCVKKPIPDEIGQLNHYRKKCFYDNRFTCTDNEYTVTENKLFWKYKDEFIKRTNKVLKKINLI